MDPLRELIGLIPEINGEAGNGPLAGWREVGEETPQLRRSAGFEVTNGRFKLVVYNNPRVRSSLPMFLVQSLTDTDKVQGDIFKNNYRRVVDLYGEILDSLSS